MHMPRARANALQSLQGLSSDKPGAGLDSGGASNLERRCHGFSVDAALSDCCAEHHNLVRDSIVAGSDSTIGLATPHLGRYSRVQCVKLHHHLPRSCATCVLFGLHPSVLNSTQRYTCISRHLGNPVADCVIHKIDINLAQTWLNPL